jgi:hypothetical protein
LIKYGHDGGCHVRTVGTALLQCFARGFQQCAHATRSRPQIRVNWDKPKIYWGTGKMRLRDGFEVRLGKTTPILSKIPDEKASRWRARPRVRLAYSSSLRAIGAQVPPEVCFSIVTDKRSLDLQAHTVVQRDEWLWALGILRDHLKGPANSP